MPIEGCKHGPASLSESARLFESARYWRDRAQKAEAELAARGAASPDLTDAFRRLEFALYGKADNTWEKSRAEAVMNVLRDLVSARSSPDRTEPQGGK